MFWKVFGISFLSLFSGFGEVFGRFEEVLGSFSWRLGRSFGEFFYGFLKDFG